jgi:hypothetical protein
MEYKRMSTPAEGEEHSAELLRIFNQEAKQKMTGALKPAKQGEANSMDIVDMYE